MQMVCQPRGTTAASVLDKSRDDEVMRYFTLDGALPDGRALVLNAQFATLSLISNGDERPRLVAQQQFTASELSLLLPLLELYPHYCPYEAMFASFYNGAVTEETVERCRRQLQDALDAGVWDQQMRPVRNVLSRVRFKMRSFGIDIVSILETGYILMMKTPIEQVEPTLPLRASAG
ncbi:MAG TPA: hypothetical protein VGT44_09995 [Ktedonobacteraceae bacterium]|nr:hypothetical protein [Ktedonobacteraceae bacterium]